MDVVIRLFVVVLLANMVTPVRAQSMRDGYAVAVKGGKPWYPIACPRVLGYQIKGPIFTASKGFVGPTATRSGSGLLDPVGSTPSGEQISLALAVESSCNLPELAKLALTPERRSNLVRVQHLARHMPARFFVDADDEELAIRALRRQRQFSLESVSYHLCKAESTPAFRAALAELTPGPIVALGGVAWVPLLNPLGDLAGPGLLFIAEDSWRYSGLAYVTAGLRVQPSRRNDMIWEALYSSVAPSPEDYEVYYLRCPMPEAPEPLPWAEGYELNLVPPFQTTDWEGENVLGAVQRLAITRMAQDERATGPTQLTFAEIQIMSLRFEDAPEPGTPMWRLRIEMAKQHIDSGIAKGADATRIAPLIRWLANRYIVGEPGFKQDLAEAERLLKMAIKFGDNEAAAVYASINSGEIEVCNDHLYIPDFAQQQLSQKPQIEVIQACF